MRPGTNYFMRSGLGGGCVDESELDHPAQHVFAPVGSALRIADRIVFRRPLRHACQRGSLAQREIVELLAEIGFRGGGDAVGALPEEDHVEIQRENFFLGEITLQPVGDERLLQLAHHGFFLREERAARGLHRDRAAALRFSRGDIDEQTAQDSLPVEAVMLEEAVVLRGNECLAHHERNLFVLDRVAALLTDLRDEIAGARVHAQRHRELVVLHRRHGRQRRFEVDIAADEGVCDRKCDRRHTHQQLYGEAKVVWLHRIHVSTIARALCPMHSNRRRYAYSPKGGDAKLPVYGPALAYDSGVAGSGSSPELIRITALWFQCTPRPEPGEPPPSGHRGITRGIRQFRERRLVQFNFTLIYSVSRLRLVARFTL